MNSLLQRRRLHLSAVKKSSAVLHRPTRRGQPVADPNRTSGTIFNSLEKLLNTNRSGEPVGSPLRRFVTSTYA